MIEPITTPGKTYAVTSPNGCTVTQHVGEATIVHDVPAGVQTLIIAQAARMEVSDDAAVVTECGGSAELVFTAATTRAASSGTGSDGMTAEKRALLNGAAQREGDNTFTAGNTFTGAVDMSGARVTPPEGWNVADLTPEAIQAVVPMAWRADGSVFLGEGATSKRTDHPSIAIGKGAESSPVGVTIGTNAKASISADWTVLIGAQSKAPYKCNVVIGANSEAASQEGISIGYGATIKKEIAIAIGSRFTETTDSGNVSRTCTTEGTGSITIGAGANTRNYTATDGTVAESSNAITIGCKAENKGNDSVVIGASATSQADNYSKNSGSVVIGAGATHVGQNDVVIGKGAKNSNIHSVAIGAQSVTGYCAVSIGYESGKREAGRESVIVGVNATASHYSTAIGRSSAANSKYSIAIGRQATVSDYGATVIRSTAEDGTYTQLYFSGANTPLANTYENGEAMMGYVVRDSAGNIMTDAEGNAMVGTQKLSALFPNNRGENAFTPAMLGLDDEWTPKPMFRPSDLDMPQEEPTEPEEYQPLPVYPIVEPEIPEMEEV